jgi:hypothetical protein
LFPDHHSESQKREPKQQHERGGKQIGSRVVTGKDVADPHKRMTALRDDTDRNDDRQVAIEVGCGHKKEDSQRQIKNAGDLDLSDVKWWPRRDGRVEPSWKGGSSDAKGKVPKTEEPHQGS